jgi:hypothetical protein
MLGQKQWGTLGRGAPFAFRNDASRVKTELALLPPRLAYQMTQLGQNDTFHRQLHRSS